MSKRFILLSTLLYSLSAEAVLISDPDDLFINAPLALTGQDLVLQVVDTVSQSAGSTVVADGLALQVGGETRLTDANDVDVVAINSGDLTIFRDIDDLTVGTVSDAGTTTTGILTSDDDVVLITDGSINIDEDISTGTGNVFLDADNGVTQNAGDTITGAGLAVRQIGIGGTTALNQLNDVDQLAADTSGPFSFTDSDSLTIGSITVDGMTITGLSTTGDTKLTVGGNLTIDEDINVGTEDLFLDVDGSISQNADDTIVGEGLAVRQIGIGGTTALNQLNDVDQLAADTTGPFSFTDSDSLTIGSITVDGMTITGITSADSVTIQVGSDLTVAENINAVSLAATGDGSGTATVDAPISVTDTLLMTGFDTLNLGLANNLVTSGGPMQFDVDHIVFDALGIALSDGLIFQILNAPSYDFVGTPDFASIGLAAGFALDTSSFFSDGFVTAIRSVFAVPEPGKLALIGLGFGLLLRRKFCAK